MGKLKNPVYSSSSWEVSSFGGFSQLLYDLEEYRIPYNFDIDYEDDIHYLTYYTKNKLLGLFLYKCKEYGLLKNLLGAADIQDIKNWYGFQRDKKKIIFSKESVKTCLKHIISKETELKALFINYSNLLSNSKISYSTDSKENHEVLKEVESNLQNKVLKLTKYEYKTSSFLGEGNFSRLKDNTTFNYPKDTYYKIRYTDYEEMFSQKLLNSLDISFDMAETKITNLVNGKLDIAKIAEAVSSNGLVYYKKELHDKTKPFSVCILNDESGSMYQPSEYDVYNIDNTFGISRASRQHIVTKILYKAFSQVLPPHKIYVYGHSGATDPIINVYQDKYHHSFEESYGYQFVTKYEQNYDGPVIEKIYEKVRSFTDDAILFIVISDGEPGGYCYGGPNDFEDLKRVIEKCKRDRFVTCGIGVEYLKVKQLYQYNTIITDLSKTDVLVSQLINNVVKTEFQ